jgi:hypothetical protein
MNNTPPPPHLICLTEKKNEKPGTLVAINDMSDINMPIRRVFYIYGFNTDPAQNKRGYHGHKNTTQILIALHGSLTIGVKNAQQENTETFCLTNPHTALCVPCNHLIELNDISSDAIILVLCDTTFAEDVYFTSF